jgi:hypothetical protein
MFVLEALESGDFSAFGTAIVSGQSPRVLQFDAFYKIESSVVRLTATGRIKVAYPAYDGEFYLMIRSTEADEVAFEYRDQWLPQTHGTGTWVKDCYLLSGQCNHTASTITCYVEPKARQTIEVRCVVQHRRRPRVTVSFTVCPHEPSATLANVVSLHQRRMRA